MAAFFAPPGHTAYQDDQHETLLCPQTAAAATCAVTRGEAPLSELTGIINVQEVDHPYACYSVISYLKKEASSNSGSADSATGARAPARLGCRERHCWRVRSRHCRHSLRCTMSQGSQLRVPSAVLESQHARPLLASSSPLARRP